MKMKKNYPKRSFPWKYMKIKFKGFSKNIYFSDFFIFFLDFIIFSINLDFYKDFLGFHIEKRVYLHVLMLHADVIACTCGTAR